MTTSQRIVLVLVLGFALSGCANQAAAPPSVSAAGQSTATGQSAAGQSTGALRFDDPPHLQVQAFPPAGSCHARRESNHVLPDRSCTPGALDAHVNQGNLGITICRPGGYTKTVRPPVHITDKEKQASMRAYGVSGPPSGYEFDHLVPLSLGGSPNSPSNLWPEPGGSPNSKDKLEGALQDLVCSHRLDLGRAQLLIATDWVNAYRQLLGTEPG